MSEAGTWSLHLWLCLHGSQGSEPPARQCSCATVPSHLPILPHCPGQELRFSLRTQPPTTTPTCRPTGIATAQHSSAPGAVPRVFPNRAALVPQLPQPCSQQHICSVPWHCPAKPQAHHHSASLCSVPHSLQSLVMQKDPLAKALVWVTTHSHGQELMWTQCFTSISLANHTASSPSADAKANLAPCPSGASGPTWVCRAGLLSPGVASLLCG